MLAVKNLKYVQFMEYNMFEQQNDHTFYLYGKRPCNISELLNADAVCLAVQDKLILFT